MSDMAPEQFPASRPNVFRKTYAWLRGHPEQSTYWFTRIAILRLLGVVYFFGFYSATQQIVALIGEDGLLPVKLYTQNIENRFGTSWFWDMPTLFWWGTSDTFLLSVCWIGVALSIALIAGVANAPIMAALWALYLSLNQIGQLFYGYGWEIQLLETGFLAIWLVPTWKIGLLRKDAPPPIALIWLYRWLIFRIMLGAGLIKLRGDPCWLDLTCLQYHYETQPIPNPLSWALHQMPVWFHTLGILSNHAAELVVPWLVFGPRRLRHLAGIVLVGFQITLIVSGNLSFLNWLTLIPCLACFDDSWFKVLFRRRHRATYQTHIETAAPRSAWFLPSRFHTVCVILLVVLIAYLSIDPIRNLVSPGQAMNRSFGRLHLVNTYGAFGSIGKTRHEIILQGTHDNPKDPNARWLEYEFKCKPGSLDRRPCILGPYHHRLDWQIWFAAMSNINRQPWLVHFIYKMLEGDKDALDLLAHDPFADNPAKFIRAELYEYRFSSNTDEPELWWQRQRVREYMHPVSLDSPELHKFMQQRGWWVKD
ncbi:MAG: lipase maturation factor family protein [Myxococcota bacterium]|jgi:hypothetical protein|nr:lipase maturation factor family protein [Myxococcota bacterium]